MSSLKQHVLGLFWSEEMLSADRLSFVKRNIILADEIMQLKKECAELRQRVHDVEIQMQM